VSIRSIERGLRVLQEMNLQPYTSIASLHERTRLPKPTLVRILKTLEQAGELLTAMAGEGDEPPPIHAVLTP